MGNKSPIKTSPAYAVSYYPAPLEVEATIKTVVQHDITGLGGGKMCDENQETIQRWTAKRRTAPVLSVIKGEASTEEATRKHGLKVAEIEEWREKFFSRAENARYSLFHPFPVGSTPSHDYKDQEHEQQR